MALFGPPCMNEMQNVYSLLFWEWNWLQHAGNVQPPVVKFTSTATCQNKLNHNTYYAWQATRKANAHQCWPSENNTS